MTDDYDLIDWHDRDEPRANRALILACLGSAFVVAVGMGIIAGRWW